MNEAERLAMYCTALLRLTGMTHYRLRKVLIDLDPQLIWESLAVTRDMTASTLCNVKPVELQRWRKETSSIDPLALYLSHLDDGVAVLHRSAPNFPERYRDDESGSEVLFVRGNVSCLNIPSVAIVGTRRCTAYGRAVAKEFAETLVELGFVVTSGLALGIDGVAQDAAIAAGGKSVGVVANGLNLCYPNSHKRLSNRVATAGAVVSEYPFGVRPDPWRFPLRNRIIAALSDGVIVIESNETGGSLSTAVEAMVRDVVLMAVPGTIYSDASVGTNALLVDGAIPVVSAENLRMTLKANLSRHEAQVLVADVGAKKRSTIALKLGDADRKVYEQLDWTAVSFETLLFRTGLEAGPLMATLQSLNDQGGATGDRGWWVRVR